MLKNYLTIAVRNLARNPAFSLINILGLSVGLVCFLLIATYVFHELSYDKQFSKSDRIYRVNREFLPHGDNPGTHWASCAPKAGPLLEADFPEIERSVRVIDWSIRLAKGQDTFLEKNYFADSGFFELFDFDFLAGNPETALSQPYNVVLTRSLAQKYFGDEDPVGKIMSDGDAFSLKVTGVIPDLFENTHLDFTMITSISTLTEEQGPDFLNTWGSNIYHTYLLLGASVDMANLSASFPAFLEKHNGNAKGPTALRPQKLSSIHLHSDLQMELKENGNLVMVRAFIAIALFVLAIACINFMNLSTARASQRAKEVGMRKVFGAHRNQLVIQFLGESLLMAVLAIFISLAIVQALLPGFANMVGRDLVLNLGNGAVLTGLAVLASAVSLAAGSYPAFFLSLFEPAKVLRGDLHRGAAGALFRKITVVFQLAICTFLLIATLTVYLQIKFANSIDLGYDRQNVIVIQGGARANGFEPFRNQAASFSGVENVTRSDQVPTKPFNDTRLIRAQGHDPIGRQMFYMRIDHDFFDALDIPLISGRKFSREYSVDEPLAPTDDNPQTNGAFMLNESAARQLGWTPEEATSKWFELSMGDNFEKSIKGDIVGVVKDVHFASVREKISPTFFYIDPESYYRYIAIELTDENISETLAHIDRTWAENFGGRSINRFFLSDNFDAMYDDERKQATMFTSFSALAVIIGCLGLFGLASYTAERRTKEIGIRKVLGASVWSIVRLFTYEYSKLAIFSILLSWPIAYLVMQDWLSHFVYRIALNPFIFILCAILVFLIVFATVGGLSARVAQERPIHSLRYE